MDRGFCLGHERCLSMKQKNASELREGLFVLLISQIALLVLSVE